jgi:hypothetical protein
MDLTIHRVRDLLKDTPRNLTESDWPTFLLEHAIAAYEDGSPANLLAPVPGRTVFLCGTIILEDDQLSVCKSAIQLVLLRVQVITADRQKRWLRV